MYHHDDNTKRNYVPTICEYRFYQFFQSSSTLAHSGLGNLIMIAVGLLLLYLAIKKKFEPLLMLPIGFGAILTNIPIPSDTAIASTSVLRASITNQVLIGTPEALGQPLHNFLVMEVLLVNFMNLVLNVDYFH